MRYLDGRYLELDVGLLAELSDLWRAFGLVLFALVDAVVDTEGLLERMTA